MYIEYIFIENFIITFFIISCTSKLLLNEKSKTSILGALLGTIVAILSPLFNLNIMSNVILTIVTAILICTTSFNFKGIKQFFLTLSLFLMVTFTFGGCTEVLKQSLGEITLLSLLFSSFVLFIIFKIVTNHLHKKRIIHNFSTKVVIVDGGKKIEEQGYFDSGNLLYDPITSKPICLITHQVFSKLYGGDLLSLFLKKIDEKSLKNGHYISINSAVKNGKILVFCVEKLIIFNGKEEKNVKDACLGLSLAGFEKAMHSQVLLHSSQM